MNENDWKKRLGVVYSTDPGFDYDSVNEKEPETLPPGQQNLLVRRDRKNRKGKTVTLVEGFVGAEVDLKSLGSELKRRCGVGGSAGNAEILIQGDLADRIIGILKEMGYQVKRSGG
jgi:translation initiation factor 1